MAAAALPLVTAGVGAISGLFGGGGQKYPKWYEDSMKYWSQRGRDQEAQATGDYGGYRDPITGEWVQGSRGAAYGNYANILAQPGYTPEEEAGMYYNPEEQAGMYYSPEELAGLRYTPEQEAKLRISPQEEAGIMSATLSPIAGLTQRATDALTRAAAARGNYGGGFGASVQRVHEDSARQAAEAARNARLGITQMRREGERDIAQTGIQAAGIGAAQRAATAGRIADQRTSTLGDAARMRLQGREFGTQGVERVAQSDLSRMMGYYTNTPAPIPQQPASQRAMGGAAAGYSLGSDAYDWWKKNR